MPEVEAEAEGRRRGPRRCVCARARIRTYGVCELYQSIYKAFRVLDWIPGYFFDIAVRRFPSVAEVSCLTAY